MSTGKTYSTKYLLDSNNNRGAAGQVLSTTSTGIDWVDANTVPGSGLWLASGNNIYNSNSGNVGINTTNPGSKLVVAGGTDTTYNDGTLKVVGSIALNAANNLNPALNRWVLRPRAAGVEGSFDIYDARNSLSRLTIVNSGNVGIGEASPSTKLSVDGVASMGLNSRLSMGILDINSNSTPTQILIQTTIPFNSPSADFTVNIKGFVYGTDESCNLSIHWHYYNSVPYNANITSSGSWAPIANLHSSSSGFIQIHLLSPGYWPKIYVESMYSSAYNDAYASGWSWSDAAGTGTAYPLDYNKDFGNNFVMTDPGNVGIGEASPGAKLEVKGDSSSGNLPIAKVISTGSISYLKFFNSSTGTGSSDGTYIGMNGGTAYLINKEAGNLYLGTGDAINLTLENGGNVGIGNTSPAKKLEISSGTNGDGILLTGTGSFANGDSRNIEFSYSDTDTSYASAIKFEVKDATVHGGQIGFFTDAGPSSSGSIGTSIRAMTIDPSQNVGIGTTSPDAPLHILKAASGANIVTALKLDPDDATAGSGVSIDFNASTTNTGASLVGSRIIGARQGGNASGFLALYTSPDASGSVPLERMRIDSSGNVGIGTTIGINKLDVAGNINIQGGNGSYLTFNNGDANIVINNNGTGRDLSFKTYDGSSNAERMRIDKNGNVGIGVTLPDSKLHVNGGTRLGGGGFYVSSDASFSTNFAYTFRDAVGINNPNSISAPAVAGYVMSVGRSTSGSVSGGIYVEGESRFARGLAGSIKFNAYDGTNNTGSPTHILGTDANGLVVKSTAGSSIGPWLPLAAGSGDPLTGDLHYNGAIRSTTPASKLILSNSSTTTELHAAGSGGTAFKDSGNNTKMVIDSSGNVGIGATGPFSRLQSGSQTFTGGNGMFANSRVGISNHGNLTGMMLASTYNDATYPEYGLVFVQGPSTSNYNVWSISPDGPAKGSGLNFIFNANTTNIHTAAPKVYFEGSTGNVGIGTDSPAEKLQVAGNVNILNNFKLKLGTTPTLEIYSTGSASFISETSAAGGNNLIISGTTGIRLTGDGGTLFDGGGGNNTSMHDANGVSRFELTTSNAIFPSGNVGIGVTNPSKKLAVNGDAIVYDGYVRIEDGASGDYMEMSNDGAGTGYSYITTSANDLLVIPQSGGLVIQGENSGSGNNASLEIYNALNVAVNVKLHSSGNSYLNGGDVGIGDTSPSNKLDVNGDVRATQYKLRGNVTNPTTTAAAIYDQSTVGLTLSAHNVELRNYNGSAMARSVFFTHNTATFTGTCTATNFILSSDKTLKDNIKEIDTKHVNVEWKNFELKSEPGVKRSGVIAQELEKNHPEFVRTDKDGLKSVAYIDLLITKIAELEARLEKAGI